VGRGRRPAPALVTVIFPLFYDLDDYRLEHVHRIVEDVHAEAGIRAYDLLPLYLAMYETHADAFVFNALHPNAIGHRLAAFYVLHKLTADGLLPLSKPSGSLMGNDAVLVEAVGRADNQAVETPDSAPAD
jgi:hypothetical protein